jgi:hypothetical protein
VTVLAPWGRHELADLVAQLGAEPHDWRRSLWQAWSIDGLVGGRWALAVKMSPVLSAGGGAASVWERLLTSGPRDESAGNQLTEPSLGQAPSLRELVSDTLAEIVENNVRGSWLITEAGDRCDAGGAPAAARRGRGSPRGIPSRVVDERTDNAHRVPRPADQAASDGHRLDPAG